MRCERLIYPASVSVDGLLHQLDDAHQEDDSEKLLDVRARIITRMNQLQAFCEQYKHGQSEHK